MQKKKQNPQLNFKGSVTPLDPHAPFFDYVKKKGGAYRSLLCLNGHLPDRPFFANMALPVIAADGAANALAERGVAPDLIIGDLDSAKPEILANYPCLRVDDQETSDFQKGLEYLKRAKLFPPIILGISGGYLDHILCNVSLFPKEENCLFYDPCHMIGFFLTPGLYTYDTFPLQTKISLIGAPSARLTSQGLKWELSDYNLNFWEKNSFFNRTCAKEVRLEIREGRLLVLFYLQPVEDAGSAGSAWSQRRQS